MWNWLSRWTRERLGGSPAGYTASRRERGSRLEIVEVERDRLAVLVILDDRLTTAFDRLG
jgi:hypothetical protein